MKAHLSEKLYWIQLMNLYTKTSYVCREHNMEAIAMNILDFSLHCEKCVGENEILRNLRFSDFAFTLYQLDCVYIFFCESKLMYTVTDLVKKIKFKDTLTSSIAKHLSGQMCNLIKLIIECIIVKKNSIAGKNLCGIGCQNCGELYNMNWRSPIMLNCNHLICINCFNQQNLCIFCNSQQVLKNIISLPLNYSKCDICTRNIITVNNLPLESLCTCTICSNCANLYGKCKCLVFSKESYLQYLKLNHKQLINLLQLGFSDKCTNCNNNMIEVFCQADVKFYCSTCIKSLNKAGTMTFEIASNYLQEMRRNIILNPEYLIENSHLSSNLSNAERVYRNLESNPECENLRFLYGIIKRFKFIYPLNQKDFRDFDILSARKNVFSIQVISNKPIILEGVIVGGRTDLKECSVSANFAINNDEEIIQKEVTSAGKYIMISSLSKKARLNHRITVTYSENYFLFSGKLTNQNIYKGPENLEFTIHSNTELDLICGPILEIIYRY
ncbi:hypothetical protein SteCoe_18102 [Stentor coeruleus]|uniref:RING-type domain-containing protein n=1 Tax=Stentor coeruleus TaxID=5963 RepID=A0A1R2BXD3_9CILI|nr:hypothetical protein SteCoe_18102 [Stentor coeruleus]